MRFSDKLIIVTVAGSGIGLAIARAFNSEGARVIATDLLIERPEAIEPTGAGTLVCRVSDAVHACSIPGSTCTSTPPVSPRPWPSGTLAKVRSMQSPCRGEERSTMQKTQDDGLRPEVPDAYSQLVRELPVSYFDGSSCCQNMSAVALQSFFSEVGSVYTPSSDNRLIPCMAPQ